MVLNINCTGNNMPSSTSSCSELIYEACPPQQGSTPHCNKCCINNMINDHTYCVLKKICRKIIKDFNRQQCREKYTVFDGGNSINVRIHRSLSAGVGAGACTGTGGGIGTGLKYGPYINANETSDQLAFKNKNASILHGSSKIIKSLDGVKSKSRRSKRDELFDDDDNKDSLGKKDKRRNKKKQLDEDVDESTRRQSERMKSKSRRSKRDELLDDKDNKDTLGKKDKRRSKKKQLDDDVDEMTGRQSDRMKSKSRRSKRDELLDDKDNKDSFGKKEKRRSKKKIDDDDFDDTRKRNEKRKSRERKSEDDFIADKKRKSKSKNSKRRGDENDEVLNVDAKKSNLGKSKGRKSEHKVDDDEQANSKRNRKSSKVAVTLPIVSDLRFKVRKGQDVDFAKSVKKAKSSQFSKNLKGSQRLSKFSKERLNDDDVRSSGYSRYTKPSRYDEVKFCDFLRANMEQRELNEIAKCCQSQCRCCLPCSPCGACNNYIVC